MSLAPFFFCLTRCFPPIACLACPPPLISSLNCPLSATPDSTWTVFKAPPLRSHRAVCLPFSRLFSIPFADRVPFFLFFSNSSLGWRALFRRGYSFRASFLPLLVAKGSGGLRRPPKRRARTLFAKWGRELHRKHSGVLSGFAGSDFCSFPRASSAHSATYPMGMHVSISSSGEAVGRTSCRLASFE